MVPVSQPVQREVTDYVDFTGRTEAVYSVDIRPRVTGYLVEMPFEEGAEVKAGDLLFVVDPRPYKAQLDQAQGQVDLYQASLKLAKTTLARDRAINASSPGSVSQQQFDQEQAVVDEADARVKAYEKSMEISRLSYEFTRVVSPIDGQISRYYLTLGNLVNQDQTLLTTVVSVDPMYVYFEMDEPTLLRTRKAVNEGKIKMPDKGMKIPVFMALQGEDGFPHQGTINFVNNQVNPDDRQHPGARCLSQPTAQEGPPAVIAGHVREDPAADRPTSSGLAGRSIAPSGRTRGSNSSTCSTRKTRPSIAGSRPGRRRTTDCASSRKGSSRMIGWSSADCNRSARG